MATLFHPSKLPPKQKKKKKIVIDTTSISSIKRIKRYAKALQYNIPKAELWFRELYIKEPFHNKDSDHYNIPFHMYIPDCINLKYKYIIEIDEDYHLLSEQNYKDRLKDIFYKSKGYKVFRIQAYNIKQYNNVIEQIKLIRNHSPTIIIRKSKFT